MSPHSLAALTADSRPLFARAAGGTSLWDALLGSRDRGALRAVYLGAANGDLPEYYDVFAAAMQGAGICRHLHAAAPFDDAARAAIDAADLLVLSGGDPDRGWRAFRTAGVDAQLAARRAAGAVLVGVSAGAVQMGRGGLGIVDAWVAVHDEAAAWAGLRQRLARSPSALGLGIGRGAAVLVGDGTARRWSGDAFWLSGDAAAPQTLPAHRD